MEEIRRSADNAMEHCTETFTFRKCLCKLTSNKDLFLQSSENPYTPAVNKSVSIIFFLNLNWCFRKNDKYKQFKIYLLRGWQLQVKPYFYFREIKKKRTKNRKINSSNNFSKGSSNIFHVLSIQNALYIDNEVHIRYIIF